MASPTDLRDRLPPWLRRYCPTHEQCWRWSAKCRSSVHRWVTWLWRRAANGWQQLDRKWRIWSGFALLAALFLPLLFVNGRGPVPSPVVVAEAKSSSTSTAEVNEEPKRAPLVKVPKEFQYPTPPPRPFVSEADAIILDAYRVQKRFVTKEILNSMYVWGPDVSFYYVWRDAGCPNAEKWLFSPPEKTIIARGGNIFRIRGWVTFKADSDKDATVAYVCQMVLDPDLGTWKLLGHIEEIN